MIHIDIPVSYRIVLLYDCMYMYNMYNIHTAHRPTVYVFILYAFIIFMYIHIWGMYIWAIC
jgi:hypothetical protein